MSCSHNKNANNNPSEDAEPSLNSTSSFPRELSEEVKGSDGKESITWNGDTCKVGVAPGHAHDNQNNHLTSLG